LSNENDDMPGFLGGGGLDYVIRDGEVYLHAGHLAGLFGKTGASMGVQAILSDDRAGGNVAHALLLIAEKTEDLRSELLKREIEASFFQPVAEQDEPGA
jgi:hypothetical protein